MLSQFLSISNFRYVPFYVQGQSLIAYFALFRLLISFEQDSCFRDDESFDV